MRRQRSRRPLDRPRLSTTLAPRRNLPVRLFRESKYGQVLVAHEIRISPRTYRGESPQADPSGLLILLHAFALGSPPHAKCRPATKVEMLLCNRPRPRARTNNRSQELPARRGCRNRIACEDPEYPKFFRRAKNLVF